MGCTPHGGGGYPPTQGFSFLGIGLDQKILNTLGLPPGFYRFSPGSFGLILGTGRAGNSGTEDVGVNACPVRGHLRYHWPLFVLLTSVVDTKGNLCCQAHVRTHDLLHGLLHGLGLATLGEQLPLPL